MNFNILQGDNRLTLKGLADNSVDAIVTDPPYGIDFLGKAWDANTGALETYRECLRVLKPGGHILAFSAARTYHHLAVTLEQAGFEIRDQLMWLYASGFPKAQDIGKAIQKRIGVEETETRPGYSSFHKENYGLYNDGVKPEYEKDLQVTKITSPEAKQWSGWKTALKPAHEPIVMARKPFKGSTIDNVLENGLGALNIDESRIPYEDQQDINTYLNNKRGPMERGTGIPGEAIGMFETSTGFKQIKREVTVEEDLPEQGRYPSNVIGEIADYQKYFYCPKVSRKERHTGFDLTTIPTDPGGIYNIDGGKPLGTAREKANSEGNNHPTVKPVELMRYLIKLVTPPNSTVLDPFCGSGSTGMAAVELGHTFIGCELDPHYAAIASRRITAWNTPEPSGTTFEELFE